MNAPRLPPGQQLASAGKWPQVGERVPENLPERWTASIEGLVECPCQIDLDRLRTLPRCTQEVDVHCVTRWSKPGMPFTGVLLADVLSLARPRPTACFVSFAAYSSRGHDTSLPLADALALRTMLAWEVNGRPLTVEHGGPVRVVTPERYFYKSLKWLRRIRLLENDELGFWEREAGYHNTADPWREQRYMAPTLTRLEMRTALKSRCFAGRALRSIDCRGHDLAGLDARRAILRDADFRDCRLTAARFDAANLSNARLQGADLREASFVGADLEGADFGGADLRGADFSGASLFGVTFQSCAADRPTRFDAATRFDTSTLESLMPDEERFVRETLAGFGR